MRWVPARYRRRMAAPPQRWPLAPRELDEPHPSRLHDDHPERAEILARHAAALREGSPGYLDPSSGLFVLSAGFLANRGFCCTRGCRHCPYVT